MGEWVGFGVLLYWGRLVFSPLFFLKPETGPTVSKKSYHWCRDFLVLVKWLAGWLARSTNVGAGTDRLKDRVMVSSPTPHPGWKPQSLQKYNRVGWAVDDIC